MKLGFIGVLATVVALALQPASQAVTRGQSVYSENWETSGPNYTHIYRAMSPNGTYAVKAEVTSTMSPQTSMYNIGATSTQLNLMKGTRVQFSASVRADAVAQPVDPNNGVKVMLQVTTPAGSKYSQPANVYGTFDFKTIGAVMTVPTDATAVTFWIGLEKAMGVAWFDDLKIDISRPLRTRPGTQPTGPIYTGHTVPKLRGCMVSDNIGNDPNNAVVLGTNWKANVARFQLTGYVPGPGAAGDFNAYRVWLDAELAKLDTFLPQAHANHMYVVIDLHVPPGASVNGSMRLFQGQEYQDALVNTWQYISNRYKNETTVWGYDIVNEPVEGFMPLSLMGWNELATRVGQAIRVIDTTHAIIVEPEFGADSSGFDYLTPLSGVAGVVYSPHVYNPQSYTHQGVNGAAEPVSAPTQATLQAAILPARNFQLDYNVNMYVGEFSAARWAPGAATYLDNAITLFDTYGWDWSYHAFREWNGWDLEYPSSHLTDPHPTTTDRQQVVKSRFSNNQIPF